MLNLFCTLSGRLPQFWALLEKFHRLLGQLDMVADNIPFGGRHAAMLQELADVSNRNPSAVEARGGADACGVGGDKHPLWASSLLSAFQHDHIVSQTRPLAEPLDCSIVVRSRTLRILVFGEPFDALRDARLERYSSRLVGLLRDVMEAITDHVLGGEVGSVPDAEARVGADKEHILDELLVVRASLRCFELLQVHLGEIGLERLVALDRKNLVVISRDRNLVKNSLDNGLEVRHHGLLAIGSQGLREVVFQVIEPRAGNIFPLVDAHRFEVLAERYIRSTIGVEAVDCEL